MGLNFTRSEDVIVVRDRGLLKVTVDRPEKRNPLSLGVLEQIHDAFADAAGDLSLNLAVVTGAGDRAFASGGDLAELAAARSASDAEALSRHGKRALNAIRTFPVPVVARLNGLALGGGAELALACDLRFAAAGATIGLIHSRLGIAPSWGGGVDLMRLVGYARGIRLLADATVLSAVEALALGMVDGVAPPAADYDEAFAGFIAGFRRQPPQVMRAIKSLSIGERMRDRAALDAAETARFVEAWTHPDHWAAVASLSNRVKA